jgi:peptide deformylase
MKLLFYPNDFLMKSVKPYKFDELDPIKTEIEILDLMQKSKGVGLAANQVGLNASVFGMLKSNGDKIAVFNPIIRGASDETNLGVEGCLSFPALMLNVKRSNSIAVSYQNKEGITVNEELHGFDARVFQHEFDHLQGVNFVDRVGKLKLDIALKKRNKYIKKNFPGAKLKA